MKDKKVEKLINLEKKRQKETINLIASENFVSGDVLEALGTVLTNKYSEGYPGKRYYPGNKYYDEIENLTKERALNLFGLNPEEWASNVQAYSGSPANFEIYSALLEPGDKLMGMALTSGGHLTHGHKVSLTGKFWKAIQYVVKDDGWIDYEAVEELALKEKPKIIVSGFTAYPRAIDFKRFGEIARKTGAYHLADISHIAGLIAAGLHPSPFPYADVVMTTTHKTLRGPRGAVILANRKSQIANRYGIDLSNAIDKAVFPGLQGGPHNNVTAAKAVAFYEALQPNFKKYQAQIIKNAKALAEELIKLGFHLVTGGTDNHLMLIDLKKSGSPLNKLDGTGAEKKLEEVGIIANRNTVPGDTSAFKPSGLRLGTPAVTTRGLKEKDMKRIAKLLYAALTDSDVSSIRKAVTLTRRK